jgi:hypothetical protein
MGTSELHNRQKFLGAEEGRYAVYFSHGDKFEVVATNEEEAKTRAKTKYFEWGGYCTRAVRLYNKQIKETKNIRAGRVRGLFSHLNPRIE